MAGEAIGHWALRDVRLVTLAALELHGGIGGPVDLGLGLPQVAVQAGLAGGAQGAILPQELVAVQAIPLAHGRDLDLLLRVAEAAQLRGWAEAVDAQRVALDAANLFLVEVDLVAGGGRDLEPAGLAAGMALEARLIGDAGVLADLLRLGQGELHHQLGALQGALLVAGVAGDGAVLAGAPALPGLLHGVAGTAKTGVVLGVAIDLERAIGQGQDHHAHHRQGQAADQGGQALPPG